MQLNIAKLNVTAYMQDYMASLKADGQLIWNDNTPHND